ncbi:hypothetical protein BsWGS_24896 [Bradybaena similaris]
MAKSKSHRFVPRCFRTKSVPRVCAQSLFVFLCLLGMTAVVSTQFREWFSSKTVFASLYTANKHEEASYLSKDSTNDTIRSTLTPSIAKTTKAMPSTCVLPQVNVYEHSVMNVAGLENKTIQCQGNYLPDLTYITQDNTLMVNKSKVEEYMQITDLQQCRYRHIFPDKLNSNNYTYSEWSQPFTDFITVSQDAEFLKVECTNNKSEIVSKTFYSLIPRKEQYDEKDSLHFKKHFLSSAPRETLNIIMIGIDSLSRNQFLRACNETYSYLMDTLNSFDMTMHSQMGNSMSSNMWPLFAGYSEEDVKNWCSNRSSTENIRLIWRNFGNAGYRTLFTEDNPADGYCQDFSKCCPHPSARYDMRPLTLAMHSNRDMYARNYYCSGNQLDMTIHLSYLRKFLDFFHDKPVFAVAMLTRPTIKDPASAKIFDEHLLNFYKSLNQDHHINRSLIVSFSGRGIQHGSLRNSVNGDVESKTPFTVLTFPDWFLKKYPDVAGYLKLNTRRLTSHFDTHATLLDLLYFNSNTAPRPDPRQHGVSMLKKIPHDRTCKDALLPLDVCLCGFTYLEDVYITSQLGRMLADLVMESLHSKIDENRCVIFKLQQVIRIKKIALDDYTSTGTRGTFAYQVKLQVIPGNGVFTSTVFELNQFNKWQVGTDIGRLDSHRGPSECLEFQNNTPFCYCKDWLPEKSNHRNNTP